MLLPGSWHPVFFGATKPVFRSDTDLFAKREVLRLPLVPPLVPHQTGEPVACMLRISKKSSLSVVTTAHVTNRQMNRWGVLTC